MRMFILAVLVMGQAYKATIGLNAQEHATLQEHARVASTDCTHAICGFRLLAGWPRSL